MIKITAIRNKAMTEVDYFGDKRLKTEVACAADALIQILSKAIDASYDTTALILMQACVVTHHKAASAAEDAEGSAENNREKGKEEEER